MSESTQGTIPPISQNSSTMNDMYNLFSNKNLIITILLILVILSMLGINLLQISGTIISEISNPIAPAVRSILSTLGFTAGNIIKGSADVVANAADFGIDIAKGTTHSIGDLLIPSSTPVVDYSNQVSLSEVIGVSKILSAEPPQPVQSSEPTVTPISTQKPKAGWCYIGSVPGLKGCMQVSEHEKCISGQIFPSKTDCLKPERVE